MLFVTVMAVALTISRYFPPHMSLATIATAGLLVLPFLKRDWRRRYAWGALSGVILAILAGGLIIEAVGVPFGYGTLPFRAMSYAVSIGWVVGATIGLAWNSWEKSKKHIDQKQP